MGSAGTSPLKKFVLLTMAAVIATRTNNSTRVYARGMGIISRRIKLQQSQQIPRSNLNFRVPRVSSVAFIGSSHSPSPARFTPSLLGQLTANTPRIAFSASRYSNFHSTSMLLMGRRRNGGRSKKTKVSPKRRKKDDANSTSNQTATAVIDNLNELSQDEEEELPQEFKAVFASQYHAPVMPTECIDALLKQGEWGEMLLARKERWRKKMSIQEAKRRKAGYYDDVKEDDTGRSTEDMINGKEAQPFSASIVTSDSISLDEMPRLFVDGTLGGGGHSQALLRQLRPGDVLVGCDVDPEALATASIRLTDHLATTEYILDTTEMDEQPRCEWEKERPMFIPVQSNFRNLISVLSTIRHPVSKRLLLGNREQTTNRSMVNENDDKVEFPNGVQGMLLDLGVSSHQIDTSERGFAFMKEGPLDMRMSGDNSQTSALTAADICNEFDEAALIDVLRTYGDEPRARRIASAIVASRPLYTTTDLVHAINSVTPTFARQKRAGLIATSARVFQALRIVVNEEDGALKEVLENVAPWALARSKSHSSLPKESGDDIPSDEGILVVLSYHSMEDKMAKRVIRDGKVDISGSDSRGRGGFGALERDLYGNIINSDASDAVPFEPLAKPRKASDEEIAANSRSRSATLRVAVRI